MLAAVLAVLCAVCVLCALPGCLPSDAITQKIYDNKDDSLEEDDAQKVLYNDIKAKKTVDTLPKLQNTKSKKKNETDQDLPRYGGDTSNALVAQPTYKNEAQNRGKVSTKTEKSEKTDEERNSGDADKSSTGEGARSAAGRGTKKNADSGENGSATGRHKTKNGSGKNAGNEVKVYEDYGDAPEIPKGITKVTAVGQAAVIVSMLGATAKKTPLVGADAELLSDSRAKAALSKKSISKAKTLWKKDGASKDLLSVDRLVKADPDLCFVFEGDDTFTAKQQKELLENKIIVYVLPALTSARKIEYAVQLVAKILDKGGNEQAQTVCDAYAKWHDDLVKELEDANGGITGGFNYDTGKRVSTNADALYTLYLSDWDATARYNDENGGFLQSSSGAGVCELSYKDSPLCHYLSVGGVVNNAATGTWRSATLSGQTAVAWQFSQTTCPSAFKYWSRLDRSKVSYAPATGDGLDRALMWNTGDRVGLGTDEFPGVIVKTKRIAGYLEKDAANSTGIYHPYPVSRTSGRTSVSGVGYTNGNSLVSSCIGTSESGSSSVFYDESGKANGKTYGIHVNPRGMTGSWTDGSVESVLESAWAYRTFRKPDYDLESKVKGFYRTFFDHDLTDGEYDSIVAGPAK